MPLQPVALYGLEVPAGGMLVQAAPDFPATFRITMAAIDPTAPAEINEENPSATPRATLKLVRQPIGPEGDDEDSEEYMRALLGGGSDDEEDSSDDEEEVNGGPSDPSKSKKAQQDAAVAQLLDAMNESDSDEDMKDAPTNGLSAKAKGKAKATDEDSDSGSEESEDLEIEEFVICTLDPERTYQQALDITVGEDERVFFQVTGSHTIYLTGNYVVPDDNGHNHHHEVYDSDDEDSENDEDYDLSPSEDELDVQLDGEESDDLDGLNDPRITELSDDEGEAPKLVSKADKKSKKRSADALDGGESLDDLVSKSIKADSSEETPKLSKKQLKKLKNNKGDAVPVKAEETKENKKVQFAKNLEQGPTGSTPEKSPATPAEKSTTNGKAKASLGVKEVNGIKIDDKKLGSGAAAKNGNRVELRYIGKTATDNKVFDSNKKGKPFGFKIGKGEVIKGWDIGIAGMQVGGERRITIPPHLGYGSEKLPGIPKNSTLTFDVKLLSIK